MFSTMTLSRIPDYMCSRNTEYKVTFSLSLFLTDFDCNECRFTECRGAKIFVPEGPAIVVLGNQLKVVFDALEVTPVANVIRLFTAVSYPFS
jgi:hypothetical protein